MALSTQHADTALAVARERAATVVPVVTDVVHTAREKGGELLDRDVVHEARRRAVDVVRAVKGEPIVAMPSRTWPVAVQWFCIGAAFGAAVAYLARRMPEPVPMPSGEPREQPIEYVRTLPHETAVDGSNRADATAGATRSE